MADSRKWQVIAQQCRPLRFRLLEQLAPGADRLDGVGVVSHCPFWMRKLQPVKMDRIANHQKFFPALRHQKQGMSRRVAVRRDQLHFGRHLARLLQFKVWLHAGQNLFDPRQGLRNRFGWRPHSRKIGRAGRPKIHFAFGGDNFGGRKCQAVCFIHQTGDMIGVSVGDVDGFYIHWRNSDPGETARKFSSDRPEGSAGPGIEQHQDRPTRFVERKFCDQCCS